MTAIGGFQASQDAAAAYDRYVGMIMTPWVHEMLADVAPQPGQAVLDVACGTGLVARRAKGRVGGAGRVVGLDVNEAMLKQAAASAKREKVQGIEWRQGDAAQLPLEDASFDVVYCQQGMQFMPEPDRVAREMRRVLRPGGHLAATTWGPRRDSPYFAAMGDALERRFGIERLTPFSAVFSMERPEALSRPFEGAGFSDVKSRSGVRRCILPPAEDFVPGHLAGAPVGGLVDELSAADRASLVGDIVRELASTQDHNGTNFSARANWVVATA